MSRVRGWTQAGSLNTMTVAFLPLSRQGAGHAIVAPATVADQHLHRLSSWLHKRSALRLPQLLLGVLFASGRRTVTSWFRAAAITDDFRPSYTTVCAVGRQVPHMAVSTFLAVKPL